MKRYFYAAIGVVVCVLLSQSALAGIIAFESDPTSNSTHVSRHGVNGPVLADDFVSYRSGIVLGIEWWGAAPLTGGDDFWEVTFHADAFPGEPAATTPDGGLTQHLFTASGTDIDGDGIFHYTAAWDPADIFILSNTTYWLSIANASGSTWTWANGAVPTIGAESFSAMVSTGVGPNGGPHFGPWSAVDANFAFRVIVAEPTIIALIGAGLIGVALTRRRKEVA